VSYLVFRVSYASKSLPVYRGCGRKCLASTPAADRFTQAFEWPRTGARILKELASLLRDQRGMNGIIIAAIGLLVVAVGVYVFLAEKARRRSHQESRKHWENVKPTVRPNKSPLRRRSGP
jgi:hypothetical protein